MEVAEAPRALIADLAEASGLPGIPLDKDSGWHLRLGEDNAYLYCRDGEQLVIVVPVCPLPLDISWLQVNYLLRENLFDSPFAPFQLATDEGGLLIQWGLLPVADLDGPSLAIVLQNLSKRSQQLRERLFSHSPAGKATDVDSTQH